MTTSVIMAAIAGAGLGYILERGDFCFHSTIRGLVGRPQRLDLFRAYLLAMLLAIPIVNLLIGLGWITPYIPPFAWRANLLGGFVFGVGMVVAATCVTGLFYKLGHGMLGVLAGLAGWALGDVLVYRGALRPLRETLTETGLAISSQPATLAALPGHMGWFLLLVGAAAALWFLWRSPRHPRGKLWSWLPLGAAVGLVTSVAWLLARAGGSNYTYGTSGVPSQVVAALVEPGRVSGGSLWIPVALICLIPGAFVAARRSGTWWLRGESPGRYARLAAGGLLMGAGAGIAGGCNLGHSLVGVPLLSLASISTTLAMVAGVIAAVRLAHLRPVAGALSKPKRAPG